MVFCTPTTYSSNITTAVYFSVLLSADSRFAKGSFTLLQQLHNLRYHVPSYARRKVDHDNAGMLVSVKGGEPMDVKEGDHENAGGRIP
jgi:hypothetical protein